MGAVPPHDESRVELALALRGASVAGAEATLREAVSAVLAAIPATLPAWAPLLIWWLQRRGVDVR